MSGANIVVVGSINLDLVAYVARMPAEGETLTGTDFATFPGGKGANQAVSIARLGGEVVMLGCLGQDQFAAQLRQGLDQAGVKTHVIGSAPGPSGIAVIQVTAHGGNSIVVIPGANNAVTPAFLEQHMDVLAGASMILSQLEIPMETTEHLAKLAGQFGIPFMLDPAPIRPLSREVLTHTSWLTPNESEARGILESWGRTGTCDLETEEGMSKAAAQILATGVRNVVLKLGPRGVYVSGKDVAGLHIEPYSVKAVDTTAAGDAFNGGFAYGLAQQMSPIEAARFGCAVAAVSVTRPGAQPSMPTLSEVKALTEA
jgi:ribokinase